MPGTPPWKLAVHTTIVTIIGQNVGVSGAFTAGTSYVLASLLDELELSDLEEAEDVRPVTSTRMNEVQLSTGSAIRLVNLAVSNEATKLNLIKKTYPYVYVTYKSGTETEEGYFRVGPRTTGTRGRGKQTVQLELRPCDPGQAQLTHSSTA